MQLRETPAQRRAFRLLVLSIGIGSLIWLGAMARLGGRAGLVELAQVAATSILFLGKFVIFLGWTEDRHFGPVVLAALCVGIDLLISAGLCTGLARLERAPVVGRGLRAARVRAIRFVTRFPGLEGMAFFGVAGFVLLPLAATGAVTGTFAGRLLGLSRLRVVAAVGLGSTGTAGAFAALAVAVGDRAEELARSPILVGATIVVLALLLRVAYVRIVGSRREEGAPDPDRP